MSTADRARAYVKGWAETGRLLEEQRWVELSELTEDAARTASDALIRAAVMTPLPESRRTWSGLVQLQACLHRRRL